MAGQEQVCCGALPAVDQDLAPLFRSPGSLFWGPAFLNKDSKAMESLLGKLHRSTAMQARLANTAAILTLQQPPLWSHAEPAGGCLSGKGVPVSNVVPGFGVQGAGSGIRPLVGSALAGETTSVAVPV